MVVQLLVPYLATRADSAASSCRAGQSERASIVVSAPLLHAGGCRRACCRAPLAAEHAGLRACGGVTQLVAAARCGAAPAARADDHRQLLQLQGWPQAGQGPTCSLAALVSGWATPIAIALPGRPHLAPSAVLSSWLRNLDHFTQAAQAPGRVTRAPMCPRKTHPRRPRSLAAVQAQLRAGAHRAAGGLQPRLLPSSPHTQAPSAAAVLHLVDVTQCPIPRHSDQRALLSQSFRERLQCRAS
jgi:hypothetical protein